MSWVPKTLFIFELSPTGKNVIGGLGQILILMGGQLDTVQYRYREYLLVHRDYFPISLTPTTIIIYLSNILGSRNIVFVSFKKKYATQKFDIIHSITYLLKKYRPLRLP